MSSPLVAGAIASVVLLLAPAATPSIGARAATPAGGASSDADEAALAELDRAVEAARTLRYRGSLTVASFGQGGPQVTSVEVARSADGRLRAERRGAWELGRDADGSYLRTSRTGALLRLGGVSVRPFERDRFLRNYRIESGGTSQLDTGPANVLLATRRDGDVRSETLHVDRETGLIVRRETRDVDGRPVRVVAYTELEVDPATGLLTPPDADGEVERLSLTPVERRSLADRGVPAARELPGGFELLDASEVETAEVPTVHLVYGDGLYTLSLYVQRGRLATHATAEATRLDVPNGGAVWRWPGSEPRRVVWTGDGRTFTALTDAPTGALLTAVAALPSDPAPSTFRRLARGLSRVGDRILPPW
ncbi:MAG: sigma-E factor regulatory protein RseB domain-containing protein [Nitriliruptor sp.]